MKTLIRKLQQTWANWFPSKITFPQWYWYITTTLEDKVDELYENGTLDEIEDRYFHVYISPNYLELLKETKVYPLLNDKYSIKEYNQLMIKAADSYIEKELNKTLKEYLLLN